jgi:LCP family protein required for cell wall assembly
MSQVPSPFEPGFEPELEQRVTRRAKSARSSRQVRKIPSVDQDAVPTSLQRREATPAPRRGRPPLFTFALGLGLGFLLGQHQPLGPLLAAVAQVPQRLQALGLGQKPVLVLGSDAVSGSTDVMFAVQIQKGITEITQVPRDTYVETPDQGVLKANALYGQLGPAAVKHEVSQLLAIPVQHHLKVNLAAVGKVADALGGVEVDVPKRMFYQDHSQGLYIDLYPGLQVLKGENLEGFLRFRHDETGDLGRMERQRLVINQVFRKLAQPTTLAQLPALLKIAGEDIKTDLSPLELTQLLGAMAHTKLSTRRLAGREYWENNLSYWMPASNGNHPSGNGETPPN